MACFSPICLRPGGSVIRVLRGGGYKSCRLLWFRCEGDVGGAVCRPVSGGGWRDDEIDVVVGAGWDEDWCTS